jgi:hypothetical protein
MSHEMRQVMLVVLSVLGLWGTVLNAVEPTMIQWPAVKELNTEWSVLGPLANYQVIITNTEGRVTCRTECLSVTHPCQQRLYTVLKRVQTYLPDHRAPELWETLTLEMKPPCDAECKAEKALEKIREEKAFMADVEQVLRDCKP